MNKQQICRDLSPSLGPTGREHLAVHLSGGPLFLPYEVIKDWDRLHTVLAKHDLGFNDGQNGITVFEEEE